MLNKCAQKINSHIPPNYLMNNKLHFALKGAAGTLKC